MNYAATWRDSGICNSRYVSIRIGVVELPFQVWVPKPINASCPVVKNTAVYPMVVQVQMVVPYPDLPSAHAADATIAFVWLEKIRGWPNFFESACLLAVMIVFACQKIECLDISAMVHKIGCRPAKSCTRILQRID